MAYPIQDLNDVLPAPTPMPPISHGEGANKFKKAVGSVLSMSPHAASKLEVARQAFQPSVPALLLGPVKAKPGAPTTCVANEEAIKARFPNLYGQPIVDLAPADGPPTVAPKPLKVGCVLSGGQAAGGHNCICGLYDYVTKHYPGSTVYGFLGGPKGVMTNTYKLLDDAIVDTKASGGALVQTICAAIKKAGYDLPKAYAKEQLSVEA